MTRFIRRLFGLTSEDSQEKSDDFSRFFHDAKSAEKAKLIRQIMREATEEQQALLKRYREKDVVEAR